MNLHSNAGFKALADAYFDTLSDIFPSSCKSEIFLTVQTSSITSKKQCGHKTNENYFDAREQLDTNNPTGLTEEFLIFPR